jgi:CRP-like cAMP-binding protein
MATRIRAANALLAVLPHAAHKRVLAELTPVALKTGEVLYEAGQAIRYVYFPIDCVICLLMVDEGQKPVEVGLIGHEGMLGVSVALGVSDSVLRAAVRSRGGALRMDAPCFKQEFLRSSSWQRELFRYTNSQLSLVRQAVACHCCHRAEARVACCLLITSDRVGAEEFKQDQDSMAASLGLTRSTVSMCAGQLRERNLISYARGKIRILDRKQLETAACECYEYGKVIARALRSCHRSATGSI